MKRTFNITGSLRSRMALLFGLIVLIGCLLLSYVSVNRAGSALETEAIGAMLKVAKQVAETQDSRIQARIYVVEALAARNVIRGVQGDREATLEEKMKALLDEQKRTESLGFKRFGIIDKAGNAVYSDGSTANLADRDYFKAALGGKSFVSSSIVSKVDKSVVFIYATPIRHYATNEIIGVLTGTVDGAKFSELVSSVNYGRTGYAFAVDSTGKTIAHKDTERVIAQENLIELAKSNSALASLADIVSRMAGGEEGIGRYTFEGVENIVAYAPIKTTGWSIAVTAPKAEVLERVASLKWAVLVISVIIILVALVLTFVIAGTISSPVKAAADMLKDIAQGEGDLTRRLKVSTNDEVGELANWFNIFIGKLQDILRNVAESATQVASTSEELSASAEESAKAVEQISETVQQVASGAQEQSTSAANTASSVTQLTQAVNQVAKGAESQVQSIHGASELVASMRKSLDETLDVLQTVGSSVQGNAESATKGSDSVRDVVSSMERIRTTTGNVAERIGELNDHSQEIGRILEVIDDIAEQTNLLALNAAIEAARAGEHGRGFAVVADEVRKLAERSSRETKAIADLIGRVKQATEKAVEAIDSGRKEVEAGSVIAQEAGRALEEILASANQTQKLVGDLISSSRALKDASLNVEKAIAEVVSVAEENTAATEEMAASIEEMKKAIDNVAAVSEESAAAVEEVSASTEEVNASIQEMSASAESLAEMAQKLQELVAKFKV
ncbi:MAG TPA: HAMP domain-containing protein [Firmicutes bacterium]|nr:HAMP domain-containing protein [Bacillota bacterium]